MGKAMFSPMAVCLSVCPHLVGGTPFQVWIRGYPIPGLGVPYPAGGIPCPRSRWEVPHPADGREGVPHPRSRQGSTPSYIRMGEYPLSRTEWGNPHQDCMGYPLPPSRTGWGSRLSGDRSAQRTLTTRRAVCLLRSRRRTFLFVLKTDSVEFYRM